MQATELWRKLPDVPVIEENMRLFWYFVAERQNIWYKRFVLKQPAPWTKDRILRLYKYTNVYRELDRGTIYYQQKVALAFTRLSLSNQGLLWLTVMYRLLNDVDTFDAVKLVSYEKWPKEKEGWHEKLQKRSDLGFRTFTNAHLTVPTMTTGGSKIEQYIKVLTIAHTKLPRLAKQIEEAKSLEQVFELLLELPAVGRFIAYEICCDLMLVKAIPFSENDWVNPGPGCKRGTNLIYPRLTSVKEYQDAIKHLQENQNSYFTRYGLTFHRYKHPLTLRGIEHSLCESCKYFKMIHKVGKQRMGFKPRPWGTLIPPK